MKRKLILVLVLFSVFLILPLTSAANTVTLNTPAANTWVAGATYLLNATLDTNTLIMENATFYYSTDSGATWTFIKSIANNTDVEFSTTWDSTSHIDAMNMVFNVTVRNATAWNTEDTSTGVDIDNGAPTASFSSGTFTDGLSLITTTNFVVGLAADSTIGISNCTVWFTETDTGTITSKYLAGSGNACTTTTNATAESLNVNEAYTVLVEARDANSNLTNSSSRTLIVTPISGGGGGTVGSSSSSSSSSGGGDDTGTSGESTFFKDNIVWVIIGAIAILIVIASVLAGMLGKTKKRRSK